MKRTGRRLLITTSWDDGHPLDLRVADMLAKHGLPATFYLPLKNSRQTLSATQIRDLSSSFEVGAHTIHHVVLTAVSNDIASAEIAGSKERLQDITGTPCVVFCFPNGRYNNVHMGMLRNAGFMVARTVELMSLDEPRRNQGIAVMPTTIQACPNTTLAYLRNAVKRLRAEAVRNICRFHRGEDWASMAIALLNRARDTGGVFHLWGHSWEIEEKGQWQALDRVFAALGDMREVVTFCANSELCSR